MTSRFRGPPKDEPKSSSLLSSRTRTYLGSDQEPKDKYTFEGSLNRVSKKNSKEKVDHFSHRSNGRHESNGQRPSDDVDEADEDPDLLYRRSRDHFASWDIKDIVGDKSLEDIKSKNYRKSRFDLFKSNGIDKKMPNKDVRGAQRSPDGKRSELNDGRFDSTGRNHIGSKSPERENDNHRSKNKFHHEETDKFGSVGRKYEGTRSPDRENDRHRSKHKFHEETVKFGSVGRKYEGTRSPERAKTSHDEHEGTNDTRPKRRALLQEIENFGSLGKSFSRPISPQRSVERRYDGNRSPDRENDKIRSLIDRFKSKEGTNDRYPLRNGSAGPGSERHDSVDRKFVKIRSPDNGTDKYRGVDERETLKYASLGRESSRDRYDDDENDNFASVNRKWNGEYDDKDKFGSTDRKHNKTVSSESGNVDSRHNKNFRSLDRKHKRNDDANDTHDHEFRKRSDTYSIEKNSRRKSREIDEDAHAKDNSSRRRSHAYEGSPENFDVHIQRYERALLAPRRDPELNRKSSMREPEVEVKRRSSLKKTDYDRHERKDRHSRPLSPPRDADEDYIGNRSAHTQDKRRTSPTKDWYESNKQFATKYLQENSKLRSVDDRLDIDRVYAKDRQNGGPRDRSISPRREFMEIKGVHVGALNSDSKEMYFGERGWDPAETHRDTVSPRTVKMEPHRYNAKRDPELRSYKSPRNSVEADTKNATVVKILNASEGPPDNERRHRRGTFVVNEDVNGRQHGRRDDDHKRNARDKEWNSVTTPSRKIWEYREGGVQITDVEEGQPCLQCGDTCPGFLPHSWRKNCTSCKCPREAHDVCHEEWVSVRARLGLKGDGPSGSVGFEPRENGFAWAPPGLPLHKVEEYFSMLPEVSVPRLGTPGERHRDRQLATQLPKQDLAGAYCRHLDLRHSSSADDFMAARNEIALDIGTVQEVLDRGIECAGCQEPLEYGSLAVSASKLVLLYHPSCFQCTQCRELLVDLAYCVHDDTLYCERHYAEQLKPRCAACDELIFSGEYTKAMNKDWHSGHFCCWQCDESLTGQRYVLRDEHPYCIKCYESVFANGCEECNKIIGIDSKDLSYKDKHWHEACFLCNKCRVSLVDKQFGSKVDKIYCGNCYDAQFASRCDGCGEIFRAGTKKMEYKTRQWHEKCFCCVVCKNAIGTKSFIPREQEIYCAGCYEDKFATRCVKCNKIITSGGVTYKNEPWHRECFTCSNCSTSLAGQRFTSRDEKPYCADCFGELFAKRCTACTKPITGIGGTRFISFEDRHWHNDCFICAGCETSLVGRGFITDGDDIICPECAKQKLM